MSKESKHRRRLRRLIKDKARCPECQWPAVPSSVGDGQFRCCNRDCSSVGLFRVSELAGYSYDQLEQAILDLSDRVEGAGFEEVVESITRPVGPVVHAASQPQTTFGGGPLRRGDMVQRIQQDLARQPGHAGFIVDDDGDYGPLFSPQQEQDVFTCDAGDITDGRCPVPVPQVLVPAKLYQTWIELTRRYDTEWMALLLGEYDEGRRVYIIRGMYFPPQVASGAHVALADEVGESIKFRPGTIGAVHSHVAMGVFFSGCDEAHSNWAVEIVVNRRAEYRANVRHKLDCGRWAKASSKLKLTGTTFETVQQSRLDTAFELGEKLRQAKLAKLKPTELKVEPAQELKVKGRRSKALPASTSPATPPAPSTPATVSVVNYNWCICGHHRSSHASVGGQPDACALADCDCKLFRADGTQVTQVEVTEEAAGVKEPEELVITLPPDEVSAPTLPTSASPELSGAYADAAKGPCRVCNQPTSLGCAKHNSAGPLCLDCDCPECVAERASKPKGIMRQLIGRLF